MILAVYVDQLHFQFLSAIDSYFIQMVGVPSFIKY